MFCMRKLCQTLFLLDLYCGTAGVAAAFQSLGGEALGMDHIVGKKKGQGDLLRELIVGGHSHLP